MFPSCKDLFDTTSSSDDNLFYGFSEEELNMARNRKVVGSTIVNSNTIDPGSGAIDTPTATPTFGFQDRLGS